MHWIDWKHMLSCQWRDPFRNSSNYPDSFFTIYESKREKRIYCMCVIAAKKYDTCPWRWLYLLCPVHCPPSTFHCPLSAIHRPPYLANDDSHHHVFAAPFSFTNLISILAFTAVLCQDNLATGYALVRVCTSLGYLVSFGWGYYLCVYAKIYFHIAFLTVAILCYFVTEYLEHKRKKFQADAKRESGMELWFSARMRLQKDCSSRLVFGFTFLVSTIINLNKTKLSSETWSRFFKMTMQRICNT